MATKQDFFIDVLKKKGNEATTREMMIAMDESDKNIRDLSRHLKRRNKIKITHNKTNSKKPPYHMNTYKIIEKKRWQSEQS